MIRLRHWALTGVLLISSMLFAGIASATPINFQLTSVTAVGAAFPASQTFLPGLPLVGSGDIDFGAGTGTLTLPDYSVRIDVGFNGLDAIISVTGWTQTITSMDVLGNITTIGGGTQTCQNIGGLGGFICPAIDASPTIAGWPPLDGTSLVSSAILDTDAGTITVIDNSNANAGTVTSTYHFSIVPEPGTAILLGGGLIGLALKRRA